MAMRSQLDELVLLFRWIQAVVLWVDEPCKNLTKAFLKRPFQL